MLETAFKSSVDVAKAKMMDSGVQLDVVSKIVPLYDSFETQHHGKLNLYCIIILRVIIMFFTLVLSMRNARRRCVWHVWTVRGGHGSHRAIDLRLQGNPSHTDSVGYKSKKRVLSNQSVPTPEHFGRSDCFIIILISIMIEISVRIGKKLSRKALSNNAFQV